MRPTCGTEPHLKGTCHIENASQCVRILKLAIGKQGISLATQYLRKIISANVEELSSSTPSHRKQPLLKLPVFHRTRDYGHGNYSSLLSNYKEITNLLNQAKKQTVPPKRKSHPIIQLRLNYRTLPPLPKDVETHPSVIKAILNESMDINPKTREIRIILNIVFDPKTNKYHPETAGNPQHYPESVANKHYPGKIVQYLVIITR